MNPESTAAGSGHAPDGATTDVAARMPGESAAIGTTAASADPALESSATTPSTASAAVQTDAVEPAAPADLPAGGATNLPGLSPAACGTRLAELFPALFAALGAPGPFKPIKLRIHTDIQARAPGVFSKRVLGIYFSRYTTTNAYLKALTLAPQRFDLDGQPAGEISDEHRRLAAEELARRHALALERRAAQRPPSRRDMPPREEGGAMPAARREAPAERRTDARPDAPPAPRRRTDGPRADRRSDAARPSSPERPAQRPLRSEPAPRAAHAQRPEATTPAPAAAALPVDPAQRERMLLLRSYESSPLSKANFCALKGITEAALDAALAESRAEHGAPPVVPASPRSRMR